MIYELNYYKNKKDWEDESSSGTISWETEEKNASTPRGKLLTYISWNKTIEIPFGIETIGKEVFFGGNRFDVWDLPVEKVVIPSTVKTIEDGAFYHTYISKIQIDPASTCGFVRDYVLYSGDGKTLLWLLDEEKPFITEDEESEEPKEVLIVPEGVERIASYFYNDSFIGFDILQCPASVKEIGNMGDEDDKPLIRAPKGSKAIEIAKRRGFPYEET